MVTAMLSREEVLKIAALARFELTEEEIKSYQTDLGRVLEYVASLSEVKTDPSALVRHVPADAVAYREDRAIAWEEASQLLENAPESEDNQFSLPTVLEGGE